jgi:hypothetical protein
MLFKLLAFIGSLVAGQDVIGSTGCSTPTCVFANANLRFGTGVETSVNTWGLFQQPWYYSHSASAWYKLTFANYPLDTAIGTGTGSPNWSGANILNLYALTATNSETDYSGFIVDTSDTAKSVGHGQITASRSFTVSGQQVIMRNTFSLGLNDSFVKITTRVINNDTALLQNVIIWTGTRDDYVGMTDVNTKTRGNLNTGNFTAVTANNQTSRAIMITNTNEGVLFYSETPGVMTAYALCCSFSNVYNTYPLTLAPATPTPTDGSYAAVLPLGNISVGSSGTIVWYYAAGAISSLGSVAENVAAAQVADVVAASTQSATPAPTPAPTATPSPTASPSPTATITDTMTATGTPTATTTISMTPSATESAKAVPGNTIVNITQIISEYITTIYEYNTPPAENTYLLSVFIPIIVVLMVCLGVVGVYLWKTRFYEKPRRSAWTPTDSRVQIRVPKATV